MENKALLNHIECVGVSPPIANWFWVGCCIFYIMHNLAYKNSVSEHNSQNYKEKCSVFSNKIRSFFSSACSSIVRLMDHWFKLMVWPYDQRHFSSFIYYQSIGLSKPCASTILSTFLNLGFHLNYVCIIYHYKLYLQHIFK